MKAIGFKQPFKLEEGNVFETFELDMPTFFRELLVKIQSISVNPVDTKQRLTEVKILREFLGFDAVGTVQKLEQRLQCLRKAILYFITVRLINMVQIRNINLLMND